MEPLILDSAKLFAVLQARAEQSFTLERNAIPYVLRNTSQHALTDSEHNVIAPGAYLVIQPNGAYHQTNIALHETHGQWRGHTFNPLDAATVDAVRRKSHAEVTSPANVDKAIEQLLRQNSGLQRDALQPVGWSPSISQTRAYAIPPELKGAVLKQPWGEQILDPATQVIVMVVGDKPDCYANPKADMGAWFSIDQERGLHGAALIEKLPVLKPQEWMPAMAANPKHQFHVADVDTHVAPLVAKAESRGPATLQV